MMDPGHRGPEQASDIPPAKIVLCCALVFVGAFILYITTLAPTFTWGDSADLPLRVFDPSEAFFHMHQREYRLYRLIGRLFLLLPFGDVAYRINLMTALFGALTAGIVCAIVLLRTRSRLAGVTAGAALAVSHTFWLLSVMAEVYTLATFLQGLALLLLLLWKARPLPLYLVVAAFLGGLTISHHLAGLLFIPPFVLFLILERSRLSFGLLLATLISFSFGSGVFIETAIHIVRGSGPGALARFLAAGGPPGSAMETLHEAITALAYLCYQFPAGFVLGCFGIIQLARRPSSWDALVLTLWLVTFGWAIADRVPDKYNAYVLSYPLFSVFVGAGVAGLWKALPITTRRPRLVLALVTALTILPVLVYALTPAITKKIGRDIVHARRCPFRDNAWYFLFPPKAGYAGARRYADAALVAVDSSAVILADYSLWRPLVYLQRVEGRRPDVAIVFVQPLCQGDSVVRCLEGWTERRPTYLATDEPAEYYCLDRIRTRFRLSPVPPVFRVIPDGSRR